MVNVNYNSLPATIRIPWLGDTERLTKSRLAPATNTPNIPILRAFCPPFSIAVACELSSLGAVQEKRSVSASREYLEQRRRPWLKAKSEAWTAPNEDNVKLTSVGES